MAALPSNSASVMGEEPTPSFGRDPAFGGPRRVPASPPAGALPSATSAAGRKGGQIVVDHCQALDEYTWLYAEYRCQLPGLLGADWTLSIQSFIDVAPLAKHFE